MVDESGVVGDQREGRRNRRLRRGQKEAGEPNPAHSESMAALTAL